VDTSGKRKRKRVCERVRVREWERIDGMPTPWGKKKRESVWESVSEWVRVREWDGWIHLGGKKKRVCVWESVSERVRVREWECVRRRDREKERETLWVCLCVREREWEGERERQRERETIFTYCICRCNTYISDYKYMSLLQKSPIKETYILQKRLIITRILLIAATPQQILYSRYAVATISRLLQIIGLFCKRAL